MTVHCFTSIINNYIPKARILAKTLKKHNPEWILHVVINEPPIDDFLQDYEPFDNIISLSELGIPSLEGWLFQHKVTEICTAIKGHTATYLFDKKAAGKVIYLDPDIAVFNSLQPIADLLDQYPIILAPHLNKPEQKTQDIINNEIGALRWGVFNLGFFAVSNCGQGIDFINWWKERLLNFCRDDIPLGLFTDQRWCNLAPVFFDKLHILRDSEYDVATWNITHRNLKLSPDGEILVDNKPLRFYHFSGYDSGAGSKMVDYYASNLENNPVREIWDWYDRQLIANGQNELGTLGWTYNYFDNGEKITDEMRSVYHSRLDLQNAFPNPFSTFPQNGGFFQWWTDQYLKERNSQPKDEMDEKTKLLEIRSDIYDYLLDKTKSELPNEYISLSTSSFDGTNSLVKLIAFYLPQFHPIPENDIWWGKGFTEWTNVSKALPQFPGHYQPHLPGELGFYDLRVLEVQKRQIELAKQYGIYGFSFYYYWFAGKRLLERPIDQFLNHKEMDFPFCLIWANENWTRRWDGLENDILIQQIHTPKTDIEFIKSVEPYLSDERYIRFGNRPVLIVYRVGLMPDAEATASRWREYCIKHSLGDPYLIAAQTFGFEDPRPVGFDAAIQFPPHNQHFSPRFLINSSVKFANPNYDSCLFSYPELIKYKENELEDAPFTLFKTVFPGWDNEPRKPGRGTIFTESTPDLYKRWLQVACRWTLINHSPNERFVFINAWNEWGEGAYLEPDRRFGYAYLQATLDALRSLQ